MDANHTILQDLLAAQDSGESVVLATVVKARGSVPRHAGSKMLVYGDGRTTGTIGGGEMEARVVEEAQAALAEGKPRTIPYTLVDPKAGDPGICGGEMEIYVEPYLPPPTVFVIGCGHVGQAVADLAHWLGYRVVVTDDRVELATPEIIPQADIYLPGDFEDGLAKFKITSNTFICVVTRNVALDRQILPQLLASPSPFIGVMGSKRRWEHTCKLLREDGLSETDLARFHSPLGLELNAETPQEIAISVLAEAMMLRRGGDGRRMSGSR
ncbi:MAG: dehydrogenase [Chloroflexi bacterium]|nr:dehydrogenase [Chloroflexota bacterium]